MGWIDARLRRVLAGSDVAIEGSPEAEDARFVITLGHPLRAAAMVLSPEYRIPEG